MKYLFLLLIFAPVVLWAQPVTTIPVLPNQSASVLISFDAARGDKGLMSFAGDVYVHTGVITDKSSSGSDWKYTRADWLTNTAACKLARTGTDTYQITLLPSIRDFYGVPSSEKILKMAFVFRSADGTKTGRDVGGNDIFVNIYENGLNVSFSNPTSLFTLAQEGQLLTVQVGASDNDSICLFLDQFKIKSTTGQSLSQTITASGTVKHLLVAVAYKGTEIVSDSIFYLVKGTVENTALHTGAKDGITYTSDTSALFVLVAPYKNYIYLIGDFNNWMPDNTYLMKKDGNRFWVTINGLKSGKEYIFQYLVDGDIRIADPYSEKISDPWNDSYISSYIYPNLIPYPQGKTTEIAGVIQTGQLPYEWQTSTFAPPPKDKLVVYELLIRDFTANKDIKTITDTLLYLKRLGVNAIELMPFNEFEGNGSWGYNPSFYFAPDKAYGTKDDFKRFIDECHKNGIAVIQDQVLNHSYGQSPLARMYMSLGKPTAQNPWYNQTSNMQNPDAQWGLDFNHQSYYTQKLVDSIASFWMSEYKVDGFRYDFTKGFTNTVYGPTSWGSDYDASRIAILKRMTTEVWKRKADAIVIFEHLAVNDEEKELANFGILLWGNMNGSYNEATMGYNDSGKSDFSSISYQNRGWTYPNLMGYIESHDEERLMYKNLAYGNSTTSYNIKDLNVALKRMALAANLFLTVPGPKMLWQFGELGYDVSINQDGRLSSKPVKWDYYEVPERRALYNTFSALIRLKTTDTLFSTNSFTTNFSGIVKDMVLTSGADHAITLSNFDVTVQNVTYNFPDAGKWYEFYSGDSLNLTTPSYSFTMQPGEYRLYCNRRLSGQGSLAMDIKQLNSYLPATLFPNPCTNRLTLDTSEKANRICVFSLAGSILMEINNPPATINVENLSPGVYFLHAFYQNAVTGVYKFVKL